MMRLAQIASPFPGIFVQSCKTLGLSANEVVSLSNVHIVGTWGTDLRTEFR